jgi:hypothetical protein
MNIEKPPLNSEVTEWVWKGWFEKVWNLLNDVPVKVVRLPIKVNQSAALTSTLLYTVPITKAGLYRINFNAGVTRAATTSSVLGGTNGFQVTYTDPTDSVARTTKVLAQDTDNRNTTAAVINGNKVVYAKANTSMYYTLDYTSVGATSMQYDLNISVEYLGQ